MVLWSARPGNLHRGTVGQGLAVEAATPDVRCLPEASVLSFTREKPGHLVRQAAELSPSLPVGTDEKALKRPVNPIFRQKLGGSYSPHVTGSVTAQERLWRVTHHYAYP